MNASKQYLSLFIGLNVFDIDYRQYISLLIHEHYTLTLASLRVLDLSQEEANALQERSAESKYTKPCKQHA